MKRLKRLLLVGLLLVLESLSFSRAIAVPLLADANGSGPFSGTLEARQTLISAEVVARVVSVHVAKGDQVRAGDPLVDLDDALIKSALAEAESAVHVAQANVEQAKEQARPGNVALAEAGVAQARATLSAAKVASDDAKRALGSPQDISSQLHQWEAKLQAAANDIEQAQAVIGSANSQLLEARNDLSNAGKYRVASLEHQLEAGNLQLQAARANLAGTQQVAEMYRRLLQNPLELVAAKNAAEKQVAVAESEVKAAQAELAWVQRTPQVESVALAQSKLAATQATLLLVQRQAKRYSISSPVNGTVLDRGVDTGETTRAGGNVMTLANTEELQMTIYLPLFNLNSIRVGQSATIRLPSMPGKTYLGHVSFIASDAEFKPANLYDSQTRSELVFAVRITFPNSDQDLKAGLYADATLR